MNPVDEFVQAITASGNYTPRTLAFYREQCDLILRLVQSEVDPTATPSTLTVDQLIRTIELVRQRYAVATQKNYLFALKRMCEFYDNDVFKKHPVIYPSDTRPTVDWLDYDQAMAVLKCWKTPLEEMIVALELCHGLRRCEVLRMRLSDIHDDYMVVRGKGRAGGKLRSVPFHPDFPATLDRYISYRTELKSKTEPGAVNSDHLLVYLKGGQLHAYEQMKGRAIDDNLTWVMNQVGFKFSNHTLRRTFGRELYRSGVDLTVIAVLYGHTNTTQTMRYLGLNLDDMADAMKIFKLRKEKIE